MSDKSNPLNLLNEFWLKNFDAGAVNGANGVNNANNPSSSNLLLSEEELDKKITELQTIEKWVQVNLQMLQSSIQTMTAQKQLLAGFKNFASGEPAQTNTEDGDESELKTKSKPKTSKTKKSSSTPGNLDAWSNIVKQYTQIVGASIASANDSLNKEPQSKTPAVKPKPKNPRNKKHS